MTLFSVKNVTNRPIIVGFAPRQWFEVFCGDSEVKACSKNNTNHAFDEFDENNSSVCGVCGIRKYRRIHSVLLPGQKCEVELNETDAAKLGTAKDLVFSKIGE